MNKQVCSQSRWLAYPRPSFGIECFFRINCWGFIRINLGELRLWSICTHAYAYAYAHILESTWSHFVSQFFTCLHWKEKKLLAIVLTYIFTKFHQREGGFYSSISHHTQLLTCHIKLESLQKSLSIHACHKYYGHMLRNSFSRCCYEKLKHNYMRAVISICVVGNNCSAKLSCRFDKEAS